ncbi:MAG: hypothetical protein Q9M94_01615 [Candidatus Gracilibacteria bacterium]|nr:hypothetical protein [Candidatus Gracilibacteria bacterium]MDQ7022552.1 hypothetical protein [Candidatus Gracilibacteria bacterium]
MSKYIKIVGNITEEVEIHNSASVGKKDTSNLEIDNNLYINILDYWTNLMKIYFEIPGGEYDKMGVDLIYESHKQNSRILIDIKTQTNINSGLNLYLREFSEEKLKNRNYIIFNKTDRKLFGKIIFVSSNLISLLFKNNDFKDFLNKIKIFKDLTQKYINSDDKLNKNFQELKKDFNNKEIILEDEILQINFLEPRKDKNGIAGNTNFKENIKIEIKI